MSLLPNFSEVMGIAALGLEANWRANFISLGVRRLAAAHTSQSRNSDMPDTI
jgi:hypothetical protein